MKKNKNWTKEKGLFLVIGVLVIVIIILAIYLYAPKSTGIEKYTIEITEITGDCEECFDTGVLVDSLTQENDVEIKAHNLFDYNSKEGKEIITRYNLKTVPAMIIFSKDLEEININPELFSTFPKYAIFDKSVPYIDLNTGEIKGIVHLKEIQSDGCMECVPLSQLKIQFEQMNVKIGSYEVIGSYSDKGKELIEKNNLSFTSSLLISKDIEEYWWVFDPMKDSLIEKEDGYLFKSPLAPYVDIKNNEIKGLVDIILVENKSCEDCFNVSGLKESFLRLGIYFENEKIIDISSNEGKNLLKKYNITAIPTVILSKEIQDYAPIQGTLEQAGTFESDGKYVFRKLDSLNVKYQEID